MRLKFLLLIILTLLACNRPQTEKDYLYDLNAAYDSFDYPNLVNKSDTDIYVYQLKNTLNRQDSFLYVNDGSNYLRQFNEENLSLRPLELETFRFSYSPFGGKPINITFNKNEIIVKLWVSGYLEPIYNERKLDGLELVKLRFMNYYFFRSRQDLSKARVHYYDSMITKYPGLNSVKYYKLLIDKYTDYDSAKFRYATQRIQISHKQYISLIDALKEADFDKLPWKMDGGMVTDGAGYTFEANTKSKFKYFVCYNQPIDTLAMTKFCRYLLHVAKADEETKL